MQKKFLSASFILSLGTLGSYLLGFIREPIFAQKFGSSSLTDAYFSAFQISDILFLICISSALLGVVQPLFLQAREKNFSQGYQTFGNFFSVLQIFYLIGAGILFFWIEEIFQFLYPQTFAKNPVELVTMGKIFLISNFIFGVSNFIGTFSIAHKRFISTSIAPMLYSAGIIFGMLFFSHSLGIYSAAYGAIFGALLHLVSRCIEYFFYSERFSIQINFSDPYLKELIFSLVFRWPIVATIPFLLLYFNTLAGAEEGLYSNFRYVHNLQSAPIAIFGIAFATASFPILSEMFAKGKISDFQKTFWRWFQKILFWTLPASIGMFFFGTEILSLLSKLPGENFEYILPFLALAIPLESLSHLFSRYFNAQAKVYIPLVGNIFLALGAVGFMSIFSRIFSLEILLAGGYLCGFIVQSLLYGSVILKNLPPKQAQLLQIVYSTIIPSLALILTGIFLSFLQISLLEKLAIGIALFGILFFGILKFFWKEKFFQKIKEMI